MTDLQHLPVDPFTDRLPAPTATSDQFARMGRWLDLFMRTEKVAQILARTSFVPDGLRGQPENIAAAMMKSLELGIDPLDGLANIHVIKGKIGFSAEFMRRRILQAGHEIVIDESTDDRCKMRGRRAGSDEWQQVTFTSDQARKAKIDLGSYPADKLVARASSRLCRRVFPDVLAGMPMAEELEDYTPEPVAVRAERPMQRKRQPRKAVPASTPKPAEPREPDNEIAELLGDEPDSEPATEESEAEESEAEEPTVIAEPAGTGLFSERGFGDGTPPDDDEPTPEPITPAQLKKLAILLREAGFDERDSKLAFCQAAINRDITSSKDLWKHEGSHLIDLLQNPTE